jgi:hypothetical protein
VILHPSGPCTPISPERDILDRMPSRPSGILGSSEEMHEESRAPHRYFEACIHYKYQREAISICGRPPKAVESLQVFKPMLGFSILPKYRVIFLLVVSCKHWRA